nr:MAG TPA: Fantastic Four meristem regulator [Caudoviricetes sp.]
MYARPRRDGGRLVLTECIRNHFENQKENLK